MKKFNQLLMVAGVAVTLAFSGGQCLAQGGNFGGGFGGDPTQRLQRQAENMRVDLGVTNDDEWAVIEPRLIKVMQVQAEVTMAGLGNLLRGRAGGAGGGAGMQRMGGMLGMQPDPAADALQAALDNNAPAAELKAAMAKVRDARNAQKVSLAKARADLKEVLSLRQEALLLRDGLLE